MASSSGASGSSSNSGGAPHEGRLTCGWYRPLLREQLVDRLDLWVDPIVLGSGTKVFDGGAVPANLRLLAPPIAGPSGTVYLRYGFTEISPGTGDMSAPGRGVEHDG